MLETLFVLLIYLMLIQVDRAEIVAYMAYERLVFGGRVHLSRVGPKNRNFNCRWREK